MTYKEVMDRSWLAQNVEKKNTAAKCLHGGRPLRDIGSSSPAFFSCLVQWRFFC